MSAAPVMVPSSEAPSVALVEPRPLGAAGREESVTSSHAPAFVSSVSFTRIYIFLVPSITSVSELPVMISSSLSEEETS